MTGKFNFLWDNFQKNMADRFQAVLHDHEFSDVTLVSHDFKKVQAHKFILSVGSVFFREMLTNSPESRPLIYLRNVDQEVLQGVVDFLYQGSVQVRQEVLQNFMAIAEDLKIEGLHNGEETEIRKPTTEIDLDNIYSSWVETKLIKKKNENDDKPLFNDEDELFEIKEYHGKELQELKNHDKKLKKKK